VRTFPKWVPDKVIAFFHHYRNGLGEDSAPHRALPLATKDQIDALMYVMQSREMEKAWKTISSREEEDDIDPTLFAEAILEVSSAPNLPEMYPSRQNVNDLRKLTGKVRKLERELNQETSRILGDSWLSWRYDYRLSLKREMTTGEKADESPDRFFEMFDETQREIEIPRFGALKQIAEYFEETANDMETAITELKAYVAKPGMEEARRIYVIRLLSEEIQAIYGQPLTDVVAATCGVILDDDIDPDQVKKLVAIHKDLKRKYWASLPESS